MDLTTEEIANKYGLAAVWPAVDEALNEYAAQEAKSYQSWLNNQVLAGRTQHKLWLDYKAEILDQRPATPSLPSTVGATPAADGVPLGRKELVELLKWPIARACAKADSKDFDAASSALADLIGLALSAPAAPAPLLVEEGGAGKIAELEAEVERLKGLYDKYKPFEPEWVYLSSGELPPLDRGNWGPNGNFMSRDLLLTVQTPGFSWVTNGRRNLNYKDGWDCHDVALAPEVRTLTAWAYPDPRHPEEIPPAARITVPASPTTKKGGSDE
jgi:hypothetical protein